VEFQLDFRQCSTLTCQVALLRAAFEPPEIVCALRLAVQGGPTFGSAPYFSFLFVSLGYLRAPSADRRQTLPHDRNLGELYNASPKIWGPSPPKKLGAKNMQNLGQFHATSDFDPIYLRNGTRYPKSERNVITSDSSRVPRRKTGELWSTTYREPYVSLDPPKLNFSEDYISAPRGAGPSNFNMHYRLTKAY